MEIVLYIIDGLILLRVVIWIRRELCNHSWRNNRNHETVCKKCGRKAKNMIR
jgi:hypothetical protein